MIWLDLKIFQTLSWKWKVLTVLQEIFPFLVFALNCSDCDCMEALTSAVTDGWQITRDTGDTRDTCQWGQWIIATLPPVLHTNNKSSVILRTTKEVVLTPMIFEIHSNPPNRKSYCWNWGQMKTILNVNIYPITGVEPRMTSPPRLELTSLNRCADAAAAPASGHTNESGTMPSNLTIICVPNTGILSRSSTSSILEQMCNWYSYVGLISFITHIASLVPGTAITFDVHKKLQKRSAIIEPFLIALSCRFMTH